MSVTVRIPFDTTTNKDLLKTGSLRKIFDNTIHEVKSEYPALFNDVKTSDEWERDLRKAGLEEAVEITEGQNIPVSAPALDTTKEYTQREFGCGFRMTFKYDFFNKYGEWKRYAADMARLQKYIKEVEAAVIFNSPTSTALTAGVGFDTKAMAATDHSLLDAASTTYSNYGNVAMSIAAIQAGRYYFSTLKNDMGRWMGAVPTVIYFEPTLFFTANEIFGSELLAHEFSNTKNVLPSMKLKLFEYHYLTGTTSWGMAAPQDSNYDLNMVTAMEPRMFIKDAPDNTQDKVCTSLQYFAVGLGDARLVYTGK